MHSLAHVLVLYDVPWAVQVLQTVEYPWEAHAIKILESYIVMPNHQVNSVNFDLEFFQ